MLDVGLVIKIPEEDYKGICHLKNEQLRMLPEEVAETLIRIANGIPLTNVLDKIRVDIVEEAKGTMNENRAGGLYKALQIIDKYKESEEEKE